MGCCIGWGTLSRRVFAATQRGTLFYFRDKQSAKMALVHLVSFRQLGDGKQHLASKKQSPLHC